MYFIDRMADGTELIIRRMEDVVMGIPADSANSDYQQYLAWVAEGNTPEPWEATNGPV